MVKLIYSRNCPHCISTKPIFDTMAVEYPNVNFEAIELSDSSASSYYEYFPKEKTVGSDEETVVFSIPMLLFFDTTGNEFKGQILGVDKDQLEFLIKNLYE